jgi:hypothetical protein
MVKLKILYPTTSADSETGKSFTFELFLKENDNALPKSIRGLEVVIVTQI